MSIGGRSGSDTSAAVPAGAPVWGEENFRRAQGWLFFAAVVLSLVVMAVLDVRLHHRYGTALLVLAAVPLALCALVIAIMAVANRRRSRPLRVVSIVLPSVAALGCVASFVAPAVLAVPVCVLLICACCLPSHT